MEQLADRVTGRIQALSFEQLVEVEHFLDALQPAMPDRALTAAALHLSEASMAGIWNNPEDDVYDDL